MHVEFINRTRKRVGVARLRRYLDVGVRRLRKRLNAYCPSGIRVGRLGLTVFFVSDAEIRRINREHRGKDRATDVITFSFVESRDFMPFVSGSGEVFPAGEIFLSMDTIARQAKEKGLRTEDELVYMLIHGFLHTFGYDHETDEEERDMELASYGILRKLYPRKAEFGFR